MPAYYRQSIGAFIATDPTAIVGMLQQAYARDGFASQYTRQTQAWADAIPELQAQLDALLAQRPTVNDWTILLEYPLYRLRRRIDVVILAGPVVVVIECKVGARDFRAEDRRQVEEYALDLRDFHAASDRRRIVPVLWSTRADDAPYEYPPVVPRIAVVAPVAQVGAGRLARFLASLDLTCFGEHIVAEAWDRSAYRPVPSVIEAATSIFAGHDVRSIANADADNLRSAAARLVTLIREARAAGRRYLLILTGVPGSGKTLAGLHVVHSAVAAGVEERGDIVYLSGNTPLVVVLREALARDEAARAQRGQAARRTLDEIRREVRARIQHINDFLQESLAASPDDPPHEHVIVFDEAQRAWDEKQGMEKFNRTASEPALLLELMARHRDWCACVCLIGGGQEINSGEEGALGWGNALRQLASHQRERWIVFAPPDVLEGGPSAGTFTLGELPADLETRLEPELQLRVPHRSYRSPSVSQWVNEVLAGKEDAARVAAAELGPYPIVLTRSRSRAERWLREHGRGERRYGLLASSGARRLRADGLGVMLHASAGAEIAHWYLNPPGDIRSSCALEVAANEYTCQGLELDLACVCWGGDLLWDHASGAWTYARLSGSEWQQVRAPGAKQFLENSYRVLLTRAREGMVLWVPEGNDADRTRVRAPLDATAEFLVRCGATSLPAT